MKQTILRTSISAFAVGVLVQSIYEIEIHHIVFFILLSLAYFVISKKRSSVFFLLISTVVLSFSFGLIRMDIKENKSVSVLSYSVGKNVIVNSWIVTNPIRKEKSTQFVVKTQNNEKIIIYGEHYPLFRYGDNLSIEGILDVPENFSRDDGKKIDWISYLEKDDIYYQIFKPKIEYIGYNKSLHRGLFYLKNILVENINILIPEPESSLASGLIVGEKNSLGNTLLDKFRKTGIIHIIVLSGYNITIVADGIIKILRFLPNTISSSFGILGIIFFAILTGASATIVRASIMAIFVILAKSVGRIYSITNSLFIAGFLMLLYNPSVLVFDQSFQLSFLATIGLIYVSPHFEKRLSFITNKFQLRSIIGATVSTQLLVLPLILFISGEISLISIPVNILILVFVPITMLIVFMTAVLASISITFALPFSIVATALLSYELFVVDIFSKIPHSVFLHQINSWYLVVFLYVFIFFSIYRFFIQK